MAVTLRYTACVRFQSQLYLNVIEDIVLSATKVYLVTLQIFHNTVISDSLNMLVCCSFSIQVAVQYKLSRAKSECHLDASSN